MHVLVHADILKPCHGGVYMQQTRALAPRLRSNWLAKD